MAITVNTNVFSLAAQRNVNRTQGNLETAMQRLSSGLRINMAKDDAAGLAVAARMETQARGATVAQRNIQDGISVLQVGDNTLRTSNDILQRMRELTVQFKSGTYTSADQKMMKLEYSQLELEIADTFQRGKFNGQEVLKTTLSNMTIQAGANATDILSVDANMSAGQLTTKVESIGHANALATIDSALDMVNSGLAKIGSYQSRMDKALTSMMAVEEAQWAARGRIMDADFARETARMTSAQVIQQAGISALGQANTMPQLALGLLG